MSQPLSGARSTLRFRPDIEGLRAVAILFVVLYHAGWSRVSGGFLGVDVFFVLSGYLITGLLLGELKTSGTVSLTNFWARRARRLLPAAAFLTFVVIAANVFFLTPFAQITYAGSARAFAVYASNILFAVRNTDYFSANATADPLLHTWSLSVEEQFYLVFAPALLLLGFWLKGRSASAIDRSLAVLAAVGSVLSLGACLWFSKRYPSVGFYLLPTRAWEFGVGALTVLLVEHVALRKMLAVEVLAFAGMAALVASALLVHDATPLGWMNLVPVLGTAALILAGAAERPSVVARGLSSSPMRLLGRLSYSWYLWHWPVLVYLREVRESPSLKLQLVAAALSLIPAAITYQFIESPVRFSTRLQRYPARVVAGAIALALVTVGAASGATLYAKRQLERPEYVAVALADRLPLVHEHGCLVELVDVTVHDCHYGKTTSDTTVVLLGDSHAAQWFPALDSIAKLRGWSLFVFTKTACPLPTVSVVNRKLSRHYTECEEWRRRAVARVVELRPQLIVAATVRTFNMLLDGNVMAIDSTDATVAAWGAGLATTLTALAPSGAPVVVLQDTPHLTFDAPSCVLKNIGNPALCRTRAQSALDSTISAAERAAVGRVTGAQYLSLNDLICDANWCAAYQDGVVRYRDTNHLSVLFAQSLAQPLSERLTQALATYSPAVAQPRK